MTPTVTSPTLIDVLEGLHTAAVNIRGPKPLYEADAFPTALRIGLCTFL